MNTKTLAHFEIKDAARGEVSAVFSTFNVVDADKDVTRPGAFAGHPDVPISAYGHSSWMGALPVGAAKIRETATTAILDGQFFMDTAHGADAFKTVKALYDRGLGDWSYGYEPAEFSFGEFDGQNVRFLDKQIVQEVSPVLVGSGVNTRTLSAKAGSGSQTSGRSTMADGHRSAIKAHHTDTVNAMWDPGAALAGIAADASVSDLRSVFARVDTSADPELKSSYDFLHHSKVGGPANLRACLAGIAALNSANGGGTDAARQGAYEHLAEHLRDADREPSELRAAAAGATKLLLHEEVIAALAGVGDALTSVSRVVALRAAKGKQLSGVNVEYLDWLDEDLMELHRNLRSLLDTPEDELAHEYLRFVASLHRGE